VTTRRHLTNNKKEPRRCILHTWPRPSRTRQGWAQTAGKDESDEQLLIIARNIKPDSTQNTRHTENRHDRGKPATNNTNSFSNSIKTTHIPYSHMQTNGREQVDERSANNQNYNHRFVHPAARDVEMGVEAEVHAGQVQLDVKFNPEEETKTYNLQKKSGNFIIGEVGKINVNNGQTLEGVRYTAVDGIVDQAKIAEILQQFFGAKTT